MDADTRTGAGAQTMLLIEACPTQCIHPAFSPTIVWVSGPAAREPVTITGTAY